MLALVVGFTGCDSDKSSNPLSPSIAGPIVGVTISAPTTLAPKDGFLIRVGDQPIQVSFNRATSNSVRPFWYEVQIGRDAAFADVAETADKVVSTGEATDVYELAAQLDPEQTYYWRVRALDGANTGPYSASAAFEIFTPLVVGNPTPTAPIGGVVIATRQATLVAANATIEGPAASVAHKFEVSTDPGFGGIVASMTVPAGDVATSATTGDLAWNTPHYWRSRAIAQGKEGTVTGPWSDAATFRTPPQPVSLGAPTLLSPISGALAPTNPPLFTVANGLVIGPAGPVRLFFHVGTDPAVDSVVTVFEASMSAGGTTAVTSPLLPADSSLYWRVFAGDGTTVSPWTASQSFRTPANPEPPPLAPSGPAPTPGCCPPPNRLEIVLLVAEETGYPESGISVFDFTQAVAERLHDEDSNWGRRINGNGNIGKDTIGYRVDGSDDNPYKVDIVAGASGSSPQPHWAEEGQIGGTWIAP